MLTEREQLDSIISIILGEPIDWGKLVEPEALQSALRLAAYHGVEALVIDRLVVAIGGYGEARFDDVDAHFVEQLGDLQLFTERHRGAGRLLAVPQSRIEDRNAIGRTALFFGLLTSFF